jgi:hypothetical protein
VEYALIPALVAIVVIATLILLGPQIATSVQNISNNLYDGGWFVRIAGAAVEALPASRMSVA